MIIRPEYRALADAAAAAGLDVESGVMLRDRLALALVVTAAPLRFAPIVAAYPPGRWLPRGAEESLTEYARRAWVVLGPLQRAVLRAGILPVVVPVHEARDVPAEVIERVLELRDLMVSVAQGFPSGDAMARALADSMAATGEPVV